MLWRVPISTQSHLSRGYFMVHLWCFLCFLGYDRQGPELKTADQRLQWSLSLCGSRDSRPIKPNKSWKSSVSSLWEEPPERLTSQRKPLRGTTGETHITEKASERNHRRHSHQRESLWEEPPERLTSERKPLRGTTGETHIREKASERNHRRDSHQRESLWEEPPETLTSERKPLRGTTGDTHIREKVLRDWTESRGRDSPAQTKPCVSFPCTLSSLHPSLIVPLLLMQLWTSNEKPGLSREARFKVQGSRFLYLSHISYTGYN